MEAEEGGLALTFWCWAGLCLMIQRRLICINSEDVVELLWSGETHWDGAV